MIKFKNLREQPTHLMSYLTQDRIHQRKK